MPVFLHVRARKFFCDEPDCRQRIFTERRSDWWDTYARKTLRLAAFFRHLAFSLSAEAASSVSSRYGATLSGDAFLYLIRKEQLPVMEEPSVIGLDDWALKRGKRYGTVICDLERRRPIELLESRKEKEVSAWLKDHPSVRITARDGSTEYAKALSAGAPQAIQVTDRWHLFHNLNKRIEQFLKRKFPLGITWQEGAEAGPSPTLKQRALTESEMKKWQVIQQVQLQYRKGIRIADICREFSLDRKTVSRYLHMESLPHLERKRRHSADPYRPIILALVKQKVSSRRIFEVLQEKGFQKSFSTLRGYLLKLQKQEGYDGQKQRIQKVPRQKLHSYLWSKLPDGQEKQAIHRLLREDAELKQLQLLLDQFQQIMRIQREPDVLIAWIECAEKTGINELNQFGHYLRLDWQAVQNALVHPWSNGLVEGHVNRIKVIKRQMYGRAKFDLLRQKILHRPL
jgi:transposase